MKLSILSGIASLSCVALAAACSSSSSNGSGGGGGGDGGGGGGEGGSDSGSGSGGGDSGGSSGGSKAYFGTMTASRTVTGTTTVYAISGGFVATPDVTVPDASAAATCPTTGTVSGSCCFVPPAAASDAGAGDAGTINLASAGAITFTDGTTPIAALNPGSNGAYGISSTNNPSVKWQPGDTLAVSAAGATVQAFTGSLVTVADFTGVTPALSYMTPTTVPLDADLVLHWTAGSASTVRVFVDGLKGTAQHGTITCDVADSSGAATVPTALLSKFTTGDSGIITLTRTTLVAATDSNATVNLLSTVNTGGSAKFQ